MTDYTRSYKHAHHMLISLLEELKVLLKNILTNH